MASLHVVSQNKVDYWKDLEARHQTGTIANASVPVEAENDKLDAEIALRLSEMEQILREWPDITKTESDEEKRELWRRFSRWFFLAPAIVSTELNIYPEYKALPLRELFARRVAVATGAEKSEIELAFREIVAIEKLMTSPDAFLNATALSHQVTNTLMRSGLFDRWTVMFAR